MQPPGRRYSSRWPPTVAHAIGSDQNKTRGMELPRSIKDGGVLLSVHCDSSDEISRAKDLLKQTGAEDIASSGEKAVSSHGVAASTKG